MLPVIDRIDQMLQGKSIHSWDDEWLMLHRGCYGRGQHIGTQRRVGRGVISQKTVPSLPSNIRNTSLVVIITEMLRLL